MTISLPLVDVGAGPAVFLLHPLAADTRYWQPVIDLVPGRRFLAYDLPGHGERDAVPRPYLIADLADELIAVMDARAIDRAAVVGVSIGGLIGQDAAARYPDRIGPLVLVDTVAAYPPDFAANLEARAAMALSDGMEAVIDPTVSMWFSADLVANGSPSIDLVRTMVSATRPAGYARACGALVAADLRAQAARIRATTTVVCGSDDVQAFTEGAAWLHENIAGSTLHWLEGGRHGAALECVDDFARILDQVLPR